VEHPVTQYADFEALVKQAFHARRKTLRNTLKTLLSAEQIESCGIDPTARAETLSVREFAELSNRYTMTRKAG
jgi:16S rRNA (adenine1518-N6/adenine1519-N6)-dimethyltransferase